MSARLGGGDDFALKSGCTHNALLFVTAVLVTVLLSACGGSSPETRKAPLPAVSVEVVQPVSFARILRLTGSVEPTRVATLSSPAEGPIMDCEIREGDQVSAGDALLSIGRESSATASLQAAREETERQQREFERVESLVEDKALPAEQLDMAKANLERARATLAAARQVSADYRVLAPWHGVVSRVHVADGKYVGPRAPLVDIFDPESVVLRFRVPEHDALALATGERVTARFDAFPATAFDLEIVRAYPELDRQLRLRTFEASLPLDHGSFYPGLFARLEIPLESVAAALTVPVDAVLEDSGGQPSVFRVVDGKAVVTSVTLGFEQDGRVWVQDGLEAGSAVVIRGLENLRDGAEVRAASSQPDRQ